MREVDYLLQASRLRTLSETFRPRRVIVERNQESSLIEHLHRMGVPVHAFQTTAESKRIAIESLSLAFERKTIKIIPDETLLNELKGFAGERMTSGLIRYGAPEGSHDDCVMALALAWQAVSEQPPARDFKIAQPSWGRR